MTTDKTFQEIYSSKKSSLIMLICSYTLIGGFLYSHIDLPWWAKITGFLSFGLSISIDGILSLREYKRFVVMSHEFYKTLEEREKAIQQIKLIAEGADPVKLGDSLLLANQGLLESVKHSGMSGAYKKFEVNGEFDSVLLLKRKSLPLDEIIEILHKSDEL